MKQTKKPTIVAQIKLVFGISHSYHPLPQNALEFSMLGLWQEQRIKKRAKEKTKKQGKFVIAPKESESYLNSLSLFIPFFHNMNQNKKTTT